MLAETFKLGACFGSSSWMQKPELNKHSSKNSSLIGRLTKSLHLSISKVKALNHRQGLFNQNVQYFLPINSSNSFVQSNYPIISSNNVKSKSLVSRTPFYVHKTIFEKLGIWSKVLEHRFRRHGLVVHVDFPNKSIVDCPDCDLRMESGDWVSVGVD